MANASVTATESTNVVTLSARTSGFAGNFALSTNNTTDITVSGGNNGQGPGYVSAIAVTAGGQGYAGGTSCTITSGGGSGATCVASTTPISTAPSAHQPAYGATPGWDMATGLGSVNAYNLANRPAMVTHMKRNLFLANRIARSIQMTKHITHSKLRTTAVALALVLGPALLLSGQDAKKQGLPRDWSMHHLVFSKPGKNVAAARLKAAERSALHPTTGVACRHGGPSHPACGPRRTEEWP